MSCRDAPHTECPGAAKACTRALICRAIVAGDEKTIETSWDDLEARFGGPDKSTKMEGFVVKALNAYVCTAPQLSGDKRLNAYHRETPRLLKKQHEILVLLTRVCSDHNKQCLFLKYHVLRSFCYSIGPDEVYNDKKIKNASKRAVARLWGQSGLSESYIGNCGTLVEIAAGMAADDDWKLWGRGCALAPFHQMIGAILANRAALLDRLRDKARDILAADQNHLLMLRKIAGLSGSQRCLKRRHARNKIDSTFVRQGDEIMLAIANAIATMFEILCSLLPAPVCEIVLGYVA
jgi:hypothetical protein